MIALESKRAKGTASTVPDTLIPLDVLGSESIAADLLEQMRWRDSVESPRCRSNLTDKNGSYGPFSETVALAPSRGFRRQTHAVPPSVSVSKTRIQQVGMESTQTRCLNHSLRSIMCYRCVITGRALL